MRRFLRRAWEFATELQRRRVYQVAAVYAITLFVLLQIADATFEPLGIGPTWVAVLVVGGVAGLPVVLVLAWMFDLTEEGVKQTAPSPVSDLLGGTPARRSATLCLAALTSLALGWGTWQIWIGSQAEATDEAVELELDPRRMAVLYLDDYSEDGSLGYLAAALTESLVQTLSSVDGLRVASRHAVDPYRNSDVPLDSIVRALKVGSLVEGSVTGAGGRIRATVQLIDGTTLEHLGSEVVEGTLDDPFAFQDSLTMHVTRALRRHLGREIRVRAEREGTEDPEAWTAFARGRDELDFYFDLREGSSDAAMRAMERADSFFRLAEQQDPDWLAPPLQRAVTTDRMAALNAPLPGARDPVLAARADSILASVLERDPHHAKALEARGQLRARLARTPGIEDPAALVASAEADLRQALGIDADLPGAWWMLSDVLVQQGRFAEGVEAAKRAMDADAFLRVEKETLWGLAYAVLQMGPGDEVVRLCDEGRRRFPDDPNFVWCRFVILGGFPEVEPDLDHAVALLDTLDLITAEGSRETWLTYGTVWLARVAARAGMGDSARALLAQVRGPGDTPPALAYDEAYVHLLLGDRAEAVRLLDRSLTLDVPDTAYVRSDWWLQELRDYEPFRELVRLEAGNP